MAEERKYYFDWMRVIVVLLVIPHHVALTYSHIGKGYVYTAEPVKSIYYFIQSDFLNLWFMILLFFISGVSAYHSLSKRDSKTFLIERFNRLLVPVIFYILVIGPITAYIVQVRIFNFDKSILVFYKLFINNIEEYLGWAQMWFCVYLFTFSIISFPLQKYLINNKGVVLYINKYLASDYNLFIPMIIIALFEIVLRPFYPGYQNLIKDWANFIVYLSFFIFGFVIGQSEKVLNRIEELYKHFLLLAILYTSLYIYLNYSNNELGEIKVYILAMLKGMAEYSLVMVIITLSRKYLNFKNDVLKRLSKSSFGLYIFHYLIVTMLNIYLIPLEINHYFKFLICIILTYATYYSFYKVFILNMKTLKFICGIYK